MPYVSVIIPTYNRAQYIADAVRSVLAQTVKDTEILVIDDGSTDNTAEVMRQFNGTVRYIKQDNAGVSAARNRGIREASGEYIAFLDSDDTWLPQRLEKGLDFLNRHPDCMLLTGNQYLMDKKGNRIEGIKPAKKPGTTFESLILQGSGLASTYIARRNLFDAQAIHGFREDILGLEDLDLCMRAALRYRIAYIEEPLGVYRVHGANAFDNTVRSLSSQLAFWEIVDRDYIRGDMPKIKPAVRKKIAEYALLLASAEYARKQYLTCLHALLRAFAVDYNPGKTLVQASDPVIRRILRLLKPFVLFTSAFVRQLIVRPGDRPSRSVNVLFYEPSTGFGGSARCLLGWLQNIDRQKFHPVVVIHSFGPAIQQIQKKGIRLVWLPYIPLFKKVSQQYRGGEAISYVIFLLESLINIVPLLFFLVLLIKRNTVTLVDCNASIITGIPCIIAARLAKRPCVVHIHDCRELTRKEALFARYVRRFIVLTQRAFDIYEAKLESKSLSIVYNGIDVKEWNSIKDKAEILKELNVRGAFIAGMIGRIAQGKGHEDFIEAARSLYSKHQDSIFLIVGESILIDREYEQNMRALVRKYGLTSRVIFTGWKDNVKEILSVFDILIFPTTTFPEGFGLSCIEAMALSKPVVATDVPGPSEIVIDNVTGFLVPPSQPKVLAEKIEYLMTNPRIAEQMGEAGRKRVEEVFDIKKVTRQIEAIYEEVLRDNDKCQISNDK